MPDADSQSVAPTSFRAQHAAFLALLSVACGDSQDAMTGAADPPGTSGGGGTTALASGGTAGLGAGGDSNDTGGAASTTGGDGGSTVAPDPEAEARLATARGARPNILFAIADDWSYPHGSVYGDPTVATPTLERLAEEGVLFDNAYVASPSCAPSRASILTGQWFWRLEEGANLYGPVAAKFRVYTDALEDAGYFVGYERKGWGPGQLGDRTRNPAGDQFASFAAFLQARPAGTPFTYWFGSHDPHRPYDLGSGAADGIDLDSVKLPGHFPDSTTIRGDVADYFFEVQRFDRELGEMMDQLEAMGELDDTIVIMTSDNGMPFPRCKASLYDCGTRVPLAVRWPGKVPAGGRPTDFVSLVDIAPTLLESAGVEVWPEISGASLLPLLTSGASGQVEPARQFVLTGKERHVPAQEGNDSGGTPMRAIRTSEFLYIRNFRPDRWPAGTPNHQQAFIDGAWYADTDNGPTKCDMSQNRNRDAAHSRLFSLAFDKRPAEELYDLQSDPNQLTNVATDAQYATQLQMLSAQLDELLSAHADPRAAGGGDAFDGFPYTGGAPKWEAACEP